PGRAPPLGVPDRRGSLQWIARALDPSGYRCCGVESAMLPRQPAQGDSSILGRNHVAGKDVFQTEAANRVRVSTAYFHDSIVASYQHGGVCPGSLSNGFWFAELVDVFHDCSSRPYPLTSCMAASGSPNMRSVRIRSSASSSLILLMAKPTWISTQSPARGGLSRISPSSTLRRTPTTSTTAVLRWSEEMSTILPGIARHIQVQVCNSESTSPVIRSGALLRTVEHREG